MTEVALNQIGNDYRPLSATIQRPAHSIAVRCPAARQIPARLSISAACRAYHIKKQRRDHYRRHHIILTHLPSYFFLTDSAYLPPKNLLSLLYQTPRINSSGTQKIVPRQKRNLREAGFFFIATFVYLRGFLIFACAAARRAIGTRKGEQDT